MDPDPIDHYATLGLDRRATLAQIRAAYRLLAKRHHPDLNPEAPEAHARSQELNAAHETLSDPVRRRAYDRELELRDQDSKPGRSVRLERNFAQDVSLRIEDFLRGVSLEVRVNDPSNPQGPEQYALIVPPETAPGTRFRLPRTAPFEGGYIVVRVRALPGFRFKVRGPDLKCELRISARTAEQGGSETLAGATGAPLRVAIPKGVGRGEVIRIRGEGLPKPRGGRGDLLVRVTYRLDVQIKRVGRQ